MKKKATKKKAFKIPALKKDIKDFLVSEEGKMSKKKIAKMGVALGAMALMAKPDDAAASCHTNSNITTCVADGVHSSGALGGNVGHNSHTSHASHTSHSSHSAHSEGGWC